MHTSAVCTSLSQYYGINLRCSNQEAIVNQECPVCRQLDSIKKVSAIIVEGTVHTTGVAIAGSLQGSSYNASQGISQSELCKTLTFSPKGGDSDRWASGGCVSLLTGIGFCAIGVAAASSAASVPSPDSGGAAAGSVIAFILALILVGIGMWAMAKSGETPQDRQAKATWETLYYCNRDDVVYIPGSPSRYVPRIQMRSLLY